MTQVWAVIAQKGGAGKTTIAIHTSIAAMQMGLLVEVFDVDPQQSAASWSLMRQGGSPAMLAHVVPRVATAVEDAKRRGVDLVIIDTSPRADRESMIVANLADMIIVPARPTVLDLPAVEDTIKLLKSAGLERRVVTVLNLVPAQSNAGEQAAGVLASMGPTLCPIRLGDRADFSASLMDGKGVTEMRKKGQAAQEIAALLKWLMKHASALSKETAGVKTSKPTRSRA